MELVSDTLENKKFEFRESEEYLEQSSIERGKLASNRLYNYGLSYLDDELIAGHPVSLTIIGADSGTGKTTLVSHIAQYNAAKGKNVYCFFLEGDPNLFADREKWRIMSQLYYHGSEGGPPVREVLAESGECIDNFTFKHYRYNLIRSPHLKVLESVAEKELTERFKSLYIYDKANENLSLNNIASKLNYIIKSKKAKPDLIIIDHLHYFEMFGDRSENSQITEIMKILVDIVDLQRIPVILVSHLRKKINKHRWVPTEEDLHGSGNIFKLASTVILTCPWFEGYEVGSHIRPTLFRIAKDRDGGKKPTVGIMYFNMKSGEYEKDYDVGKVMIEHGREVVVKICEV